MSDAALIGQSELLDSFLEFEYKEKMMGLEVAGARIWEYVRNRFFAELCESHGIDIYQAWSSQKDEYADGSAAYRRIPARLRQIPMLAYVVYRRIMTGRLEQRDLLVLNFHRRYLDGKYYDCKYTDEFLSRTRYSYYVLESSSEAGFFTAIRTKNLLYPQLSYNLIRIMASLRRVFFRKTGALPDSDRRAMKEVIRRFNDYFGLCMRFDAAALNREMSIVLEVRDTWCRVYEKLIDTIRPRAILYVSHTAYNRMAITEVARRRGIPVVELQHGPIVRAHISYNFFSRYSMSTFPDFIFIFGEYWKTGVRLPLADDHIVPVGFPYFEKKIRALSGGRAPDSDKKIILFISQTSITRQLSSFARELAGAINKNDYAIYYKLHPVEAAAPVVDPAELEGMGITVIGESAHDLYYYLSLAFCQVGVYSTSLYEGIGFNLPTFIYKTEGYRFMDALIENGYAHLVQNPADMAVLLGEYAGGARGASTGRLAGGLWKPDSLRNIEDAIEKVIAGSR